MKNDVETSIIRGKQAEAIRQVVESIDGPTRRMPIQKPGKSFQAYQTPVVFLDAVKKRFGIKRFAFDLAALRTNAVDERDMPRCAYVRLEPNSAWRFVL